MVDGIATGKSGYYVDHASCMMGLQEFHDCQGDLTIA